MAVLHGRELADRVAAAPRRRAGRAAAVAGLESLTAWLATGEVPLNAVAAATDDQIDEIAGELQADSAALAQLRDALATRLEAAERRESAPMSRMGLYSALLRAGLDTSAAVAAAGTEAVALVTGGTTTQAQSLVYDAIRALARGDGDRQFGAGFKLDGLDRPTWCCPPFSAEDWRERYDFYSRHSALTALLARIKNGVIAQIQAVGAAFDPLNPLFERYGIWDNPAGADVTSLKAATTKAQALAATAAMHGVLDDLAGRMKIDYAWSRIDTGATGDVFATGGGDGNAVSLSIIDTNGAPYDITPLIGWYDDGSAALGWTPVPNLNIFDFDRIRLRYTSTNDWFFGSMRVRLSYAPDPRIDAILRPGQLSHDPAAPNQATWDPVLIDDVSGWVQVYDVFDYLPHPASSMTRVRLEMRQLRARLDWAEQQVQTVTPNNVLYTRFDDLVTLLGQATTATLQNEPGIARGWLEELLDILAPVVAKAQRTDDERRLLFAIEVMLADTYFAQRTFPFAYAHLVRAHDYVLAEDRDYLWLKLAELFIAWGDSVYAQAGRDFVQRLAAAQMYQKVTAPEFVLTYTDGCEHEITSLWVDLGPVTSASAARMDAWVQTLSVGLWRSGTPPMVYAGLPVQSAAIVPAVSASSPPGAGGGFLRIQLDVSEALLTRDSLRLAIANSAAQVARWKPQWLRWQVGYATRAPADRRDGNGYRGRERNTRGGLVVLGSPMMVGPFNDRKGLWAHDLQVGGPQPRLAIDRPDACSATLLQEHSQLRLDSIASHLNFLGIHDEYVPAYRFKALFDTAQRLAERATVLEGRYLQFKDRAEVETLNQAEAAQLSEAATTSREIAEERARQAGRSLAMARSQVSAGRTNVADAQAAADLFAQTYKIGIQQFADQFSFSFGLGNVGVGYSWGGLASTLAGQGYEDVFRLQKFEYEAKQRQAEGALRQLEFARSIAEVEVLVAAKTVQLEQLRERFAADRLRFLSERGMNASHWYRLAGIYEQLLDGVTQSATRWAWMAERALEFEINQRVDLIRMDYHTVPLGSERLAADLELLQTRLMEFRERYRDVPNIIEREFHLSRDFHEAFTALTSPAASVESNGAAEGLRRVQFTTTMDQYDAKIPGRYAYARIFGVELEVQADVGTGLVTGYLENARLVKDDKGELRRVSTSLVRVPEPVPVADDEPCPPFEGLDDSMPDVAWISLKDGWDEGLKADEGLIDRFADFALGSSGPSTTRFERPKQPRPPDSPIALVRRAQRASIEEQELRTVARVAFGNGRERTVEAVNAYAEARGAAFRLRPADVDALERIRDDVWLDPAWYTNQLDRQIELARNATWERWREGWSAGTDVVVYKDLTPRYGAAAADWIEDYVDYTGHPTRYVLRVKNHDPDCLTLSTYRRAQDAQVFNPYESYDLLGIFGNCGVHMDWILTLKAWTDDRPDPQPVFDRIREIIMRVWYHAAYERGEGPGLADAVQRSVMRLSRSTLDLSAYRDLYDEFVTLLGDFDPASPPALAAVREFTDRSAAGQNGWLPFDIDATLVRFDDHRIGGMACVLTSFDPPAMPDLAWALRKGATGPVYQGHARTPPGDAIRALSAPAPAGFGGLNPRGRWYFRLAAADNPGMSLALLQDVQIYMEFALPGGTP